MAASGREIRGKGKRDRGWAPAEERGKRERSRSRGPAVGGRGGAPRCQGWIEKTAARGSAARRKGRGGSRGPVESERARAGLERVRVRAAGGEERGGARAEAPAGEGCRGERRRAVSSGKERRLGCVALACPALAAEKQPRKRSEHC